MGRPRHDNVPLIAVPPPFRLAATYDRLRLSIYRERGHRTHRIAIEDVGQSTFLRFDDVGYFNRVYSRGDDIHEQFDAVDQFFRGSPHGSRLLSPSLGDTGPLAEQCLTRGWIPDERYAWLSGPCSSMSLQHGGMTIRPPHRDEAAMFFRTYLEAFEAPTDRIPAAIDNMQHLFDEPALHCLLALQGRRPIGVGMLLQVGTSGLLCAGAMIPSHRGIGGHVALLRARLDLAHALGCVDVHSWSLCGSRSQAHMEQAGLTTVATTRAWRLRPSHGA